jgi:bifunctional DNA-binding transcriptional regulator/antitoxin component of YhaV-PrlF toxin-antitoxin module
MSQEEATMKSLGIIRKLDHAGRFVMPISLRRTLGLDKADGAVEIFVEGDTVMLDREIKDLQREFQACVNTLAAPYSEVINCNIQGTIRFRTPVIVKDCNIHCNRMWLAFERDGFEGPLAENQLFENCIFTFDSEDEPFIEIYSGNPMKDAIVSGELSEKDIYRIKNIVFKNCKINENAVTIGDVDALFEDSVRFIGCTK